MSIDPTAEAGFGAAGDAYERGRPGYPQSVVDLLVAELGIGAGTKVVDLAAGTGKLTRMLVPTGAHVVAVEPVAEMRRVLEATVPDVEAREGTAEALPFDGGSVDVVTVAQAFHWFRAQEALLEIARVLRRGGGLAMVWNVKDGSVPWVAELDERIHWHRHDVSHYEREDWAAVVAASRRYEPLQHRELRHDHEMTVDTLVDRVASISYIAAMDAAERAPILDQVRALVAGFDEPFPLPYRVDVWWTRRAD